MTPPILEDGFYDVPPGKVATVVTHLEMRADPAQPLPPAPEGWTLRAVPTPDVAWYRAIFDKVGADWLWFSRKELNNAALSAIIHDPKVMIWTLSNGGADGALLELDFRDGKTCEIAFFGVAAPLIGQGAGRYLMAAAIEAAWRQPITRLHLHTCTLDSPQALPFYRRAGFTPTRQQIEIADDPRLAGGIDTACAPHVPMFRP